MTTLERSINGLRSRAPEMSADRTTTRGQLVVLVAVLALAGLAVSQSPLTVVLAGLTLTTGLYLLTMVYRLALVRDALRRRSLVSVSDDDALAIPDEDLPRYTVLIPLFREAEVIADTIRALEPLDYPRDRLDVKLLLEADDLATIEAAHRIRTDLPVELVVVPVSKPRTKPKACNYGLATAQGDLVTIYDAEDRPEPLQLRRAVVAFQRLPESVACLQARLSYHNVEQNLLTRWFTIEYATWFSLVLPAVARGGGPVPLGGTSMHVKRAVLEGIGAWDAFNVTEDADLGVRLARMGHKTAVLESTTQEEANSDFINWVKQRSRWYKGYLQTWLVHMRHPLQTWRQLGPGGFTALTLLVGAVPVLALINPLFWILTWLWFLARPEFLASWLPAAIYYPSLVSMIVGNFLALYLGLIAVRVDRHPQLIPAALLMPVYWLMMSLAAIRAVLQLVVNPSFWEKSVHGLDRLFVPLPLAAVSPAPSGGGQGATFPSPGRGKGATFPSPRAREGSHVSLPPREGRVGVIDMALLPAASFLPRSRERTRVGRWLLFAACLVLYLAAATVLVFGAHVVAADALSRVANAYYTVASRDPHLAAIGFVWNPLPSLLTLPLIALKDVWPSLVQLGFAGNIVSALFLAGAAYQLQGLLLDIGLRRVLALALTATFIINPMILYLGANGASEAIFLFFVMIAVRQLSGWLARSDLSSLITAGVALGCAYLTSYQALPAALGALALVGGVSYARNRQEPRPLTTALSDAVILGAPVALAVGLWTVITWLITGDPVLQFSSVYGTGSQIHALRLEGIDALGTTQRLGLAVRRLVAVAPGLPATLLLALLAARKEDVRWLAPIGVLAPVPAVMFGGYVLGIGLPWLHFYALAAPLAILLVGFALSRPAASRVAASWPRLHGVVALAVLVAGLPITLFGMLDSSLALKESIALRSVIGVSRLHKPSADWNGFSSSWAVARYLDAHQLPDASVMVDSFTGFPIVLASQNPRQFVITNDRDFQLALNDPASFGVAYILVPSPKYQASLPSLDAVNRTYPTLYTSGANLATLVGEFTDPKGRVDWRLYRVLEPRQ